MINEQSVNYEPIPSGLTSRIYPNFGYPTLDWEQFQICGVQITGKCICESTN